MIAHSLFPTLVGQWKIDNPEEVKKTFYDSILDHINQDGYSMETTGNVDLHCDGRFDSFFHIISDCARQYLSTLSVQDNFDLNLVKTWYQISKQFHTPFHSHGDAHLSFVYYVQIPEKLNKPLVFNNAGRSNELHYGFFTHNVSQWNLYNSLSWRFTPQEGDLFVFPGKLEHYTEGFGDGSVDDGCKTVKDFADRRVALAGDFILTYKDKAAKPYGIQPVKNWRQF